MFSVMQKQKCLCCLVDQTFLFQDDGVGSFTDVDDLAGTFSKACFSFWSYTLHMYHYIERAIDLYI
jgi:hypothetical protein